MSNYDSGWFVVSWTALQYPGPVVLHDWASPGKSSCGYRWYFVPPTTYSGEHHAIPLHRDHAERVGRRCLKCFPAVVQERKHGEPQ